MPNDAQIHRAAKKGSRLEISNLISSGVDPNLRGAGERTPIHYAVSSSETLAIQTLIEAGGDVNLVDNAGWTALHYAASLFKVEVTRFLLEKTDAIKNINGRNNMGYTPLFVAASRPGNNSTLELLIKHGADKELLTNDGKTVLEICKQSKYETITPLIDPTPPQTVNQQVLDEFDQMAKQVEKLALENKTPNELLAAMLQDNESRKKVRAFLEAKFAIENLDFIEAVDGFKSLCGAVTKGILTIEELKQHAEHIVTQFLSEDSPQSVNLSAEIIRIIKQKINIQPISNTIFDDAKESIFNMIANKCAEAYFVNKNVFDQLPNYQKNLASRLVSEPKPSMLEQDDDSEESFEINNDDDDDDDDDDEEGGGCANQ
eukprot:TRINITY_DN1303_c0_g1_i1.p1 TRINITY_DN1303_c0_g1~~TRINITY_DN1303_c0_g1_i1.p1  ORF type:complete len:374 (-),score=185.00 TRINITY_DN1303_c0_g1_i1:40-1161(-)